MKGSTAVAARGVSTQGLPADSGQGRQNRRSTLSSHLLSISLSPSHQNSPFHILHQVLALGISGGRRSLCGVTVVVVGGVIVVIVLEVGEVPRVDVGRVVRRRDGKLVVLGTAGLFF